MLAPTNLRCFPPALLTLLIAVAITVGTPVPTLAAAAEWLATSDLYPDAVTPPWSLLDTAPSPPTLGATHLEITTTSSSQNQYYFQADAELDPPGIWIVELRCRLVSGSTSHVARRPITVQVHRGPHAWNVLSIGTDSVFLLAGDLTVGDSAPSDDQWHDYRIEADAAELSVYRDDVLLFSGPFLSGGNIPPGPWISWGDVSSLAYGVSQWEYFRHNGHAGTTTSVGPGLAHVSWSRVKSAFQ